MLLLLELDQGSSSDIYIISLFRLSSLLSYINKGLFKINNII